MALSVGATVGYAILGTFGAYVTTSIILLNCPSILHKQKKHKFQCAHISHRGGAAEKIENTIAAYENAVNAGSQMLELDVQMTKDKVVVVSHDEDLKRCADCEDKIPDLNFEELPLLKDSLNVTFYGSVNCDNHGKREQIPTLEEVFKTFPNTPINLDIKGISKELPAEANRLIKKYNREKITVWGNFRSSTCEELYKLNPEVPLLFSMKKVSLVYLWFYTGLLPFIPLKESFLEIPHPCCFKRVNFNMSPTQKRLLNAAGFLLSSRILFNHLKARGIKTYLWVLNEEEDFKTAFKTGAEGVMTDCPHKLTNWLNENPQYWVGKRS